MNFTADADLLSVVLTWPSLEVSWNPPLRPSPFLSIVRSYVSVDTQDGFLL